MRFIYCAQKGLYTLAGIRHSADRQCAKITHTALPSHLNPDLKHPSIANREFSKARAPHSAKQCDCCMMQRNAHGSLTWVIRGHNIVISQNFFTNIFLLVNMMTALRKPCTGILSSSKLLWKENTAVFIWLKASLSALISPGDLESPEKVKKEVAPSHLVSSAEAQEPPKATSAVL